MSPLHYKPRFLLLNKSIWGVRRCCISDRIRSCVRFCIGRYIIDTLGYFQFSQSETFVMFFAVFDLVLCTHRYKCIMIVLFVYQQKPGSNSSVTEMQAVKLFRLWRCSQTYTERETDWRTETLFMSYNTDCCFSKLSGRLEHNFPCLWHRLRRLEHNLPCLWHRLRRLEHNLPCLWHRLRRVEHNLPCLWHRLRRVENILPCLWHRLRRVEHILPCLWHRQRRQEYNLPCLWHRLRRVEHILPCLWHRLRREEHILPCLWHRQRRLEYNLPCYELIAYKL